MSGGTRSGSTPTPPQVSDDSSEVSYHTLVTNHHPVTIPSCYWMCRHFVFILGIVSNLSQGFHKAVMVVSTPVT